MNDVISPRGLENHYLKGAVSLKSLGRGTDLVVSFIQSALAVARELGEDAVSDLLGQLTLGGLRRWALWGAQAHKTDFDGQQKYFSLESPESIGVLQKESKGTLFIDVQRLPTILPMLYMGLTR